MKNSVIKSVTLLTILLSLGVGNAWAGNRRIYFDYSAVSWWKDYTNLSSGAGYAKVHCWGGNENNQDYTMSVVDGETDVAYCDIDDGWTSICFFRCGSDGTWWTKTYNYDNIGSNNYFKIKNDHDTDGIDRYKWDSATRWVPGVSIDGLIDVNNPHTQAFTFDGNVGTYEVTLSAHSTYQFCVLDGSTRYTIDNNVWTSNVSNYTLNTSGYDLRMTTAGAGTYTFTYNKSTHIMSVAYPDVEHPNIDYCYMYGYNDWTHKYLHVWNSSSSIAGTTYPGTEMHNYITISGEKYYYFAPGDYANSMPNDNNDGRKTSELTNSQGYGKYMKHNGSAWVWNTFSVRIQLNDLGATTAVNPTYQDVAFNSAVLTDLTSVPAKTHYDFGGFYTGYDDVNDVATGTRVIDEDGHWIASVAGYTDADKHWIHPGTSTTLYALWTEHEYSLTINVEPAGAGTVSPSPTTVKYVTPTALLTATPSTYAYIFKEWRYSTNLGPVSGTGSDNTVQVTASQNGTLTAVFEPRFTLVGSIHDNSGNGGMPGWSDYTAVFTINTVSPLNATCTRKLDPNTTFKFEVHDKTGLGRNLGYSQAGQYIGDNSWECNTQNSDIYLRATGHGDYTFTISSVRTDNGNYYPTVSVRGPDSHLMNLGWGHAEIDNPSSVTHGEDNGGTVSARTTESGDNYDIHNGEYVAHGGTITYTPNAVSGYSFDGWYSSNAYSGDPFSRNNPWAHTNVTSDDNVYAKFLENSTSVTLANDGHGKVQINGVDKTSTTCGIVTHRNLTAVPADGYMFSSWTKTSGDDINISSTSTNPTTLSGNGAGASSGQTVTANFTQRWVLKAESDGWGSETFTISNITDVSGDAVGYVEIELAANTNYQFTMKDLQTNDTYKNNNVAVQYMTYTNHTDWGFATNMTFNCGITTAGKGTYRFSWNITDKTMTVTYPTSYQVNYGASVGGSVTSVVDGDGNAVPNGGYVVVGGSVTYTAAANNANYTFVGWCNNDSYGEPFTNFNPWTNSNVQATSNAYAKFKSTNFVIYRTGDMSSDPRAAYDDVESYNGGTISETIEFRMRVNRLDYWYTLCLPFDVSAVQVWDDEDGAYYDLVPFYRTGGKFYTGHYIIRTPDNPTDFPIANFDQWNDPSSPTGYLPSANTPYIIQWHDGYFSGKHISFFGATGQTIPSFSAGSAPSSNDVVNVFGNNSMQSGSVTGAYLLDADYGNGAWLRDENVNASRTVLPFECYILASSTTRAKYRAIRPGMTIVDTPTGCTPVAGNPSSVTRKVLIGNQIYIIREGRIYTIQGTLVKEVE